MLESKITFVIPTIDRSSLKRAIDSLHRQTNEGWECILIYDGVEPSYDFSSDKIKVVKINKTGLTGKHHGESGLVRNYGLDLCKTEWVGFLDDDDSLDPNYVDTLLTKYNNEELIIWRMKFPNGSVIPRLNDNRIVFGNIGISISFKRKFIDEGVRFKNNRDGEDFDIVKVISEMTPKHKITEEVYYKVDH